eukprot:2720818-Alexandrium_andersonii.AAC.1
MLARGARLVAWAEFAPSLLIAVGPQEDGAVCAQHGRCARRVVFLRGGASGKFPCAGGAAARQAIVQTVRVLRRASQL